jgi:hypothetical protein
LFGWNLNQSLKDDWIKIKYSYICKKRNYGKVFNESGS